MTFDYAFILSTLPAFLKAVGVTLQVGLIAIGTSLLVALINAWAPRSVHETVG